ncbi:hypothetical protein SKA34_05275 [Photobacterium sp. SKA34]|uniref:hypothetical protein n=1 Tax=Photobacterium sp. SKA34 TaxID=121723 RepID=UPI00006BA38D|nr:hypothetical protein [Photobacterium sp. SKA34]EAR56865.1 hypothetical protein SKA34_05275 [Photobacterium sp. SKA34]
MKSLILSVLYGAFLFSPLMIQAEIVSKPLGSTTSFIETIDSYKLSQTPQQGITVYHPVLGYANYENIVCDSKDNHQRQFLHLVSSYCLQHRGKVVDNWCVDKQNNMPLFSAELNQHSMNCRSGGNASIIHVLEFLPSVEHDQQTQQNWLQVATAFGYY